jgi:hypothetical protein
MTIPQDIDDGFGDAFEGSRATQVHEFETVPGHLRELSEQCSPVHFIAFLINVLLRDIVWPTTAIQRR